MSESIGKTISPVELISAYPFATTVSRLIDALQSEHMKIFARIDHAFEARRWGLDMPPTTVLIYGNPRGGTSLMLAAPASALDLPLRILIREGTDERIIVSHHPATAMKSFGLTDEQLAGFYRLEGIIAGAIEAE